ncbi:hypothetical protein ACFL0D_05885 [Thermoproteota archaeon]
MHDTKRYSIEQEIELMVQEYIGSYHLILIMETCELCNKTEEGLSLREATHREYGKKWVCQECWTGLYTKNKMVSGSTGGGTAICGRGCPGCRNA